MGKHKTQRTDDLQHTGKRIVIAGEVQNIIEQHNFDRLIEQGVIRPVKLKGRTVLLGTELGVEPPLSVIDKV